MTLTRSLIATGCLAALAACGGDAPTVRDGPQAVHPSPSPLAQGTAPALAEDCGDDGRHCLTVSKAGDGSQPIID